jgi:hypothetical protein
VGETSGVETAAELPAVTASRLGKGLEMQCRRCKTVDRMGGHTFDRMVDRLNGFLAQHAACPS